MVTLLVIVPLALGQGVEKYQKLNTEISGYISDVYFPTPAVGYLLSKPILKSVDSGNSWKALEFDASQFPWAVHFWDEETGIVVGDSGSVWKTADGGRHFRKVEVGCTDRFFDLSFVGRDTGYAVGHRGNVIKTTDGGETWTCTKLSSVKESVGIHFVNGLLGFVAADAGKIYKTKNGGVSWETILTGTEKYLFGVFFVDGEVGYAVGERGAIVKTMDGGASWSIQSGTAEYLYSVKFLDRNIGYAVGDNGSVLSTANGGLSWKEDKLENETGFRCVTLSNSKYAFFAGYDGSAYRFLISSPAAAKFYARKSLRKNTHGSNLIPFLINGRAAWNQGGYGIRVFQNGPRIAER